MVQWTWEPENGCDEHFAVPVAAGTQEVDCTACGASGVQTRG